MNPQEAGFDGAKGICLNNPNMSDGGVFKLRRGPVAPWETDGDYRNQLVWLESMPPRLLYCDKDGKWFELAFTPVNS